MRLVLVSYHLAAAPIVLVPIVLVLAFFAIPLSIYVGATYDIGLTALALLGLVIACVAGVRYRKWVRKYQRYELPRLEQNL